MASSSYEEDCKVVGKMKKGKTEMGEKWYYASLPLLPFDTLVKDNLLQYVDTNLLKKSSTHSSDERKMCIGDTLYIPNRTHLLIKKNESGKTIRMYLVEKQEKQDKQDTVDIETKDKGKKTGKKHQANNTVAKLQQAHSMTTITDLFIKFTTAFNANELVIPKVCLTHNILEIRAIGFLYLAWFIIKNEKKYNMDNKSLVLPFSIIVSLQKFIKSITGYIGADITNTSKDKDFSQVMLTDLQTALTTAISIFKYNSFRILELAPQLIIECDFDIYIPQQIIKPHVEQIQVANAFLSPTNLQNGMFIKYTVAAGGGKTFSSLAIAHVLKELRNIGKNITLIATCHSTPVLTKISNLFYNSNIPFAIGIAKHDGTYKLSYGYSCHGKSENCIAIVCTPNIAVKLLKEPEASTKYAVFVDEITMGADKPISVELQSNMEIIVNSSKWMILSSASLESGFSNDIFSSYFQSKYPLASLIDIRSNKIYGCRNVITNNDQVVLPHLSNSTQLELVNALVKIENTTFNGSLYNPMALKNLVDILLISQFSQAFKDTLPNINELFADVSNLFADNVRIISLRVLSIIANSIHSTDEIVSVSCNTQIGSKCLESIKPASKIINYTTFGTTSAHLYPRMNLIASNHPEKFIFDNFNDLLTDIKKKCKSFSHIQTEYLQNLIVWQKQYDTIEKSKGTEDDISRQLSEHLDNKPKLEFPKIFQIGTREHVRKYGGEDVMLTHSRFRTPLQLDSIDFDTMSVKDDLLLLLCAGVGIYIDTANTSLNGNYLNTVLELASGGKLEYLIADNSICYGTDYPFGGVFVSKEFSESNSLHTIYQLINRAGRGRNSMFADIFIDENCAIQILSSIRGTFSMDTEKKNMYDMFTSLIQ